MSCYRLRKPCCIIGPLGWLWPKIKLTDRRLGKQDQALEKDRLNGLESISHSRTPFTVWPIKSFFKCCHVYKKQYFFMCLAGCSACNAVSVWQLESVSVHGAEQTFCKTQQVEVSQTYHYLISSSSLPKQISVNLLFVHFKSEHELKSLPIGSPKTYSFCTH